MVAAHDEVLLFWILSNEYQERGLGASLNGEGELDEIAPRWLQPDTLQELFDLSSAGADPATFTDAQQKTWAGLKENAYRQLTQKKGVTKDVLVKTPAPAEAEGATSTKSGGASPPTAPANQRQSLLDSERHAPADENRGVSESVEVSVDAEHDSLGPATNAQISPAHSDIDKSFTNCNEDKQELLEFFEDSPMFRKKITDFDANACNLAGFLEDIIAATKDFCSSWAEAYEAGQKLAKSLQGVHMGSGLDGGIKCSNDKEADHLRSWYNSIGEAVPALSTLAEEVMQLTRSHQELMTSVEACICSPLEKFKAGPLRQVTDGRKRYTRTMDEHEAALGKYLHGKAHKRKSAKDVEAAEQANQIRFEDLVEAKRAAELARFDFVCYLNQVEAQKRFCLVDCVCTTLGTLGSYYSRGEKYATALAPKLEGAQEEQQQSGTEWEAGRSRWEDRRVLLEHHLGGSKVRAGGRLQLSEEGEQAGIATAVAVGADAGVGLGGPVAGAVEAETTATTTATAAAVSPGTNKRQAREQREEARRELRKSESTLDQVCLATPRGMGIVKQGYLFKRSANRMMTQWHRRWFIMDAGKLYYLTTKGDKKVNKAGEAEMELCLVCDVLLCTVRELAGSEHPFCFEILSANRRSYCLQAESDAEMQQWKTAVQEVIESLLVGESGVRKSGQTALDKGGSRQGRLSRARLGGAAAAGVAGEAWGAHSQPGALADTQLASDGRLREVQLANAEVGCADCGQQELEWASINLGVMVCIECSGIHRSLGVHISKVRSVLLDTLDDATIALLRGIGNTSSNRIWEGSVQEGWMKPTPTSDRAAKEKWIRAKYQWKGFVAEATEGEGEPSEVLHQAASQGQLVKMLQCVAQGADVKWAKPDDNSTALHMACAQGHLACVEFLFQQGADPKALDDQQCTPVDTAMLKNHINVLDLLEKRISER